MATGRYHWSNLAERARFFKIDAIAAIPWIALPVFPSWVVLYVALGTTAFFIWLEFFKKMTLKAYLRSLMLATVGYERRSRDVNRKYK